MTPITDTAFWAVAVPAVLLMGLAKSGFASGFGALATPLMALALPVPQAAAIMLPLLMVMDATGLQQLWRDRDRAQLRLLLPAGLAGIVLGALLFGAMSDRAVAAVVGGLTLAFLAHRLWAARGGRHAPLPRWAARPCALVGGFTSFVVHAGGPPLQAWLLPQRLSPPVLAGTMAVFFAAINAAKWLPYAWLGLIDARNLATSLLLLPLAPLSVWAGVWLLRRVRPQLFYGLAYAGMAATGAKLLWDGLGG